MQSSPACATRRHDVTIQDLSKLGMVACIRTLLAYFLGKELEEIEHHMHAEHTHNHEKAHGQAHGDVHATPATKEVLENKKSK